MEISYHDILIGTLVTLLCYALWGLAKNIAKTYGVMGAVLLMPIIMFILSLVYGIITEFK